MKSTVVTCSYNRSMQERTRGCLSALTKLGAAYVPQTGSADVALARNLALTGALHAIRNLNADLEKKREEFAAWSNRSSIAMQIEPSNLRKPRDDFETVLMVDDDMLFSVEDAQALIDHSRATGFPASAMYATTLGTLAASRMVTPLGARQLWAVGLGLLAIPARLLFELEQRSDKFNLLDGEHTAFTASAAHRGSWYSEDYTLCARLGGCHLLPIGVGHLKTIPIYPDEHSIGVIAAGGTLEQTIDSRILERIESPEMLARLGNEIDGKKVQR